MYDRVLNNSQFFLIRNLAQLIAHNPLMPGGNKKVTHT